MSDSPDIAYIIGKLSAPIIIGLLLVLYFRVSKKRHLEKKEKKIVIWVVVASYILMLISVISKVDTSSY